MNCIYCGAPAAPGTCNTCGEEAMGWDSDGDEACEEHEDPAMWSGRAHQLRHLRDGNLSDSE